MQIEQLKQLLKTYHFIDFALLFGSCVKGTQQTLSDVNMGIYTHRPISLLEQGELISNLEDKLQKNMDLALLNDLYKKNAKLAFNIVDNQQIILCKNQETYINFTTYTYKYYFNQKPIYEMFDKALQERIKNGTYGKAQTS